MRTLHQQRLANGGRRTTHDRFVEELEEIIDDGLALLHERCALGYQQSFEVRRSKATPPTLTPPLFLKLDAFVAGTKPLHEAGSPGGPGPYTPPVDCFDRNSAITCKRNCLLISVAPVGQEWFIFDVTTKVGGL